MLCILCYVYYAICTSIYNLNFGQHLYLVIFIRIQGFGS